jgi:hypothetical protein
VGLSTLRIERQGPCLFAYINYSRQQLSRQQHRQVVFSGCENTAIALRTSSASTRITLEQQGHKSQRPVVPLTVNSTKPQTLTLSILRSTALRLSICACTVPRVVKGFTRQCQATRPCRWPIPAVLHPSSIPHFPHHEFTPSPNIWYTLTPRDHIFQTSQAFHRKYYSGGPMATKTI